MSERNYYVICDSGCRFPALTKEQTLAAIANAMQTGKIGDCDTGFITTVKTINGYPLKFFVGSQSEYESLTESEKKNLFAVITNDTTKESLQTLFDEMQAELEGQGQTLSEVIDGTQKVGNAAKADYATQATLASISDLARCTIYRNKENVTKTIAVGSGVSGKLLLCQTMDSQYQNTEYAVLVASSNYTVYDAARSVSYSNGVVTALKDGYNLFFVYAFDVAVKETVEVEE